MEATAHSAREAEAVSSPFPKGTKCSFCHVAEAKLSLNLHVDSAEHSVRGGPRPCCISCSVTIVNMFSRPVADPDRPIDGNVIRSMTGIQPYVRDEVRE